VTIRAPVGARGRSEAGPCRTRSRRPGPAKADARRPGGRPGRVGRRAAAGGLVPTCPAPGLPGPVHRRGRLSRAPGGPARRDFLAHGFGHASFEIQVGAQRPRKRQRRLARDAEAPRRSPARGTVKPSVDVSPWPERGAGVRCGARHSSFEPGSDIVCRAGPRKEECGKGRGGRRSSGGSGRPGGRTRRAASVRLARPGARGPRAALPCAGSRGSW